MDDVVKIAEGLTDAQRRSIRMFRQSACGKNWHCPTYRDMGQMRRSLEAAGIISNKGIATKRGLAVRAHLEGAEHG